MRVLQPVCHDDIEVLNKGPQDTLLSFERERPSLQEASQRESRMLCVACGLRRRLCGIHGVRPCWYELRSSHSWRKAGPLNYLGGEVDPDQLVVNTDPSLS